MKLTKKQKKAIDEFIANPPGYYAWFYKFYTKWIGNVIFSLIFLAGLLMIIFNDAIFGVVKGIFFVAIGLALWSFSAYIYKKIYTKRYAKKIGLTMEQWNQATQGMSWKI